MVGAVARHNDEWSGAKKKAWVVGKDPDTSHIISTLSAHLRCGLYTQENVAPDYGNTDENQDQQPQSSVRHEFPRANSTILAYLQPRTTTLCVKCHLKGANSKKPRHLDGTPQASNVQIFRSIS